MAILATEKVLTHNYWKPAYKIEVGDYLFDHNGKPTKVTLVQQYHTWFSPLPYAISFGALPWAIYAAAHKNPPAWLFIDFILVSVSFHFLNVIKDLEWDIKQGVVGMPQRIGKNLGMAFAIFLLAIALGNAIAWHHRWWHDLVCPIALENDIKCRSLRDFGEFDNGV